MDFTALLWPEAAEDILLLTYYDYGLGYIT